MSAINVITLVAKNVACAASAIGTSQLITNVAFATMPPAASTYVKVATQTGVVVCGLAASVHVYDSIGKGIDMIASAVKIKKLNKQDSVPTETEVIESE